MSDIELYQLTWRKAAAGYAILPHSGRRNRGNKKTKISTILSDFAGYPEKTFIPLSIKNINYSVFEKKNLGMAREFADLLMPSHSCLDERKALNFANEYGLLGLGQKEEALDTWITIANKFKRIFDLKDASGAHNTKLQQAIEIYNDRFERLWMSPNIAWHSKQTHRFLHFQPASLLAALWLMMAAELTTGLNLSKCQNPGCPKWYEQRSNKVYCSATCRVAGNRKKNAN